MPPLAKFSGSVALLVALGLGGAAQDARPPVDAKRTTAEWLRVLRSADGPPEEWEKAREALGPGGSRAKEAVPALIDALGGPGEPANVRVAQALADHGSAAVPELVRALKRTEARVRAGAADALSRVRPRSVDAVAALIAALADREAVVRREAVHALGLIRGPAEATVPALATALKDADPEVRAAAAGALAEFGPRARPAVPALAAALKDPEAAVANTAASALERVGPGAVAAVPAVVEALGAGKSAADRSLVMEALAGIGPAAKPAVPALIAALRDEKDRRAAAHALGAIGPNAAAAVPDLMKLAADRKSHHWDAAVTALGRIGPAAKPAVPLMIDALKIKEPLTTRAEVAEALGGVGPDAKAAVPALVALARDLRADGPAREAAARAVIRIDPALAAKEGMETAYLNVRLGKVPAVTPPPAGGPTDEQRKRARELIGRLANIQKPDFGLSATVTGHAFAPIPGHASWQMGLLAGEPQRTADAFRSLVEMGPAAIPSLLDALDDRTPTKLKVTNRIGSMWLGMELPGNPLNRAEARALARPAAAADDGDWFFDRYTVKVGDVCFVAVGQIVGRTYSAVRYRPSAIIIINSPVESRAIRDRVRAAWGGPDSNRRLFDSLRLEYATEGLFNGSSLDGWDEGSEFQIEAAVRLLYYFPRQAAPLIAARLRGLDVRATDAEDGWMKRDVRNGVRTTEFLKSVRWCQEPAVREALADVAKRTDDPEVKKALAAGSK